LVGDFMRLTCGFTSIGGLGEAILRDILGTSEGDQPA
jgi:hypothetical protein